MKIDCAMSEPETIHDIGKEIETRAYFLWEQAGRPEGNGWEFWMQAEGQLMDEQRQKTVAAAKPAPKKKAHKAAKKAARKVAKKAAKKVVKKAVKKAAKKAAKKPAGPKKAAKPKTKKKKKE